VKVADASFIVALRNDPRRAGFLHPVSSRLADQEEWIRSYETRPDDYYFVVEDMQSSEPQGLVSVYNVEPAKQRAEWGRWILAPGSRAGLETIYLICRFSFETLGINELYGRILSTNQKVIGFNRMCGFKQRAVLNASYEYDGQKHDAVEVAMLKTDWITTGPRLARSAQNAASLFDRKSAAIHPDDATTEQIYTPQTTRT
jgi:RimJ/RimL family protein N-acetyltransferase